MQVNAYGVRIVPMAGAFLCYLDDPDRFIEVESFAQAKEVSPIDFFQ